ncbi:hypothetical protein COY15_02010, partial [Candidatus Roizmanbacteria bacterium CG_4_10_14_0_2_um_filter_39_12]
NNTTTKQKKAGLYDPYLDIMGGGERHILSILQVLESEGYDVTIFWDNDLAKQIQNKLKLSFHSLTFEKNIFTSGTPYHRLQELQKYDLLLYVTDGSYFVSPSKNTYIFCMVPDKKLYNMNLVNKAKTANATFITNSIFTNTWLEKWGLKPFVIHPYIADAFLETSLEYPKEKIILSVGRFFPHLHSKRQDVAIERFIQLKMQYPQFEEYALHLAGSVTREDQDYLKELRVKSAHDRSIIFHENIEYQRLVNLYKSAKYYWHFAGYGVDEAIHPEKTEHLGITPLEAMASGCITFAYSAGGPKELIFNGKNGYLFENQKQLFFLMEQIDQDQEQSNSIKSTAQKFVQNNFSYEIFSQRVKEVLL